MIDNIESRETVNSTVNNVIQFKFDIILMGVGEYKYPLIFENVLMVK